jgi:formamidopyrimidine-DNA glycosylase
MLTGEMPELPDITVYIEALERRILGAPLLGARIKSPFLMRTVEPRMAAFEGRRVEGVHRLGKRIVIGFEGDLWLVLHLMIAGRLHWGEAGRASPKCAWLRSLQKQGVSNSSWSSTIRAPRPAAPRTSSNAAATFSSRSQVQAIWVAATATSVIP